MTGPLQPPAPLCPSESPCCRLLPEEGSALAPLQAGALAGQERGQPQRWPLGSRPCGLHVHPSACYHRPPGGASLTPQQYLLWPLWHIFNKYQFHLFGGNQGRRSSWTVNAGRWFTGPMVPDASLNNDSLSKSTGFPPRASDTVLIPEPPALSRTLQPASWRTRLLPAPLETGTLFPPGRSVPCTPAHRCEARAHRDQPPGLASAEAAPPQRGAQGCMVFFLV